MMRGKVFPDSSGIHEDMARILFDYYRGIAESIVAQELALEQKIADAGQDKLAGSTRKAALIKSIAIGGGISLVVGFFIFIGSKNILAGLVLGLAGLFIFGLRFLLGNKKESKFLSDCDGKIAGLLGDKAAIRRDFKVHRVGVAWVPVATKVPFQGRSVMMDNTGTVERRRFTLFGIKNKPGLAEAAAQLDTVLSTIPAVDSTVDAETLDSSELSGSIRTLNLGDWASALDRKVRRLNFLFGDLNQISVDVPVIEPQGEMAAFLERHANDEAPDNLKVRLFNSAGNNGIVESFEALANTTKSRGSGEEKSGEDFCRLLMEKAASTLQLVSEARGRSLEKINQYGLQSLGALMKGSFNYYSPELEAENIGRVRDERFNFADSVESWEPMNLSRSSRVSYDLMSDNWVAEDGSRTSNPFGMHQIFEEIFMPMVSSLMQENRIERLKIYNEIQNKKIDYLNKWHAETDDFYARNRAEINELSNRIRTITSDYLSDLNTYKALSEAVSGMESGGKPERMREIQSEGENIAVMLGQAQMYNQFIEGFNARFDNFRQQINMLAQDFEHIEFFEASLREGEARDAAQALATTNWDARRRILVRLGHQIAKGSQLPPEPAIADKAERDSMINLIAHCENLRVELDEEDRAALEAEARVKAGPVAVPAAGPAEEPPAKAESAVEGVQ